MSRTRPQSQPATRGAMHKQEKSHYIIKSVVHALDLLEQFHDGNNELGVSELSRRLKLHKNNVFRLLVTLASRNYVEQNRQTENYRLGLKNLQLGQTVINQMGLHRQARPVLEELLKKCNETCYVAVLKGAHIINIDAVEADQPVRIVPRVGIMLPAQSTAAGKVLLAAISDEEQLSRLALADLGQHGPQTATRRQALLKQLVKVEAQGFAFEDEELDDGVRGVAVPVRDYTGCVIGAISIAGPATRFSDARMRDELVPLARAAAEELSLRLGFSATDEAV
jgi:IclR family KDG regulon transcriptional repressor